MNLKVVDLEGHEKLDDFVPLSFRCREKGIALRETITAVEVDGFRQRGQITPVSIGIRVADVPEFAGK